MQPQEETKARLARKKCIVLTDPAWGVTTWHAGPQGKYQVSVRWENTAVRGKA